MTLVDDFWQKTSVLSGLAPVHMSCSIHTTSRGTRRTWATVRVRRMFTILATATTQQTGCALLQGQVSQDRARPVVLGRYSMQLATVRPDCSRGNLVFLGPGLPSSARSGIMTTVCGFFLKQIL